METTVITTGNCEVMLNEQGFYVRCTHCPYVSEITPSKSVAREWANAHDEDRSQDGRAS
jgi:hypothetical protein